MWRLSNMKQVSSAVHHTINNYQLTSKSKQFRRLTPKNEDRISQNIIHKNQKKQLLDLIHKRDYYANKIHELLNNAGEVSDPKLIDDDTEAELYLIRFMKVPENVEQIKSLVEKHKRFQEEMTRQKETIMKKHTKSATSGLAKLASVTSDIETSRREAMERELAQLHEQIYREQLKYSSESESVLRLLGVPFFVLDKEVYGMVEHKQRMLSMLQKLVENKV